MTQAETGATWTQDKGLRVAATQKLERFHMEHGPDGTFISDTENLREQNLVACGYLLWWPQKPNIQI